MVEEFEEENEEQMVDEEGEESLEENVERGKLTEMQVDALEYDSP
jgi:hypothetical protein